MSRAKATKWIEDYQLAKEPLEHPKYTVALWHASGTHQAYPGWVVAQIRSEPEPIKVA